jgi:hypothetical protein
MGVSVASEGVLMATDRPFGVTLVGVIILIEGVLGIVLALLSWFGDSNASSTVIGAAIGTVIVSLVYLLVAKGIFNGNNFSRLLVGIVTVIAIIAGVVGMVAGRVALGLGQVILGLIVLFLLYNRRASSFFAIH